MSLEMNGCHRFGHLEQLFYGLPFEQVIKEECARLERKRVFVISTASLKGTELHSRLTHALGPMLAGVYDGVSAHCPRLAVLAAARAARDSAADLVVALGGGSVIDAAKATLLCLWSGVLTSDELDVIKVRPSGNIAIPERPVRMIAIPTTLSGAEFTDNAGVSNAQNHKERFGHPLMMPVTIILDPSATLRTPRELFLSTGMRAVDHALETISSPRCDLLSEVAALRGLELLSAGLMQVAAAPDDLSARLQAQLGMWMSGIGLSSVPMGVSHGIGHILGAEFGLPHGITSCVMMSAALTWNRPVTIERQRLLESHLPTSGSTAAEKIQSLLTALGLPRKLSDVGITAESFPQIAERSMTDFYIPTNPRPVVSPADILEVLRLAA